MFLSVLKGHFVLMKWSKIHHPCLTFAYIFTSCISKAPLLFRKIINDNSTSFTLITDPNRRKATKLLNACVFASNDLKYWENVSIFWSQV